MPAFNFLEIEMGYQRCRGGGAFNECSENLTKCEKWESAGLGFQIYSNSLKIEGIRTNMNKF